MLPCQSLVFIHHSSCDHQSRRKGQYTNSNHTQSLFSERLQTIPPQKKTCSHGKDFSFLSDILFSSLQGKKTYSYLKSSPTFQFKLRCCQREWGRILLSVGFPFVTMLNSMMESHSSNLDMSVKVTQVLFYVSF